MDVRSWDFVQNGTAVDVAMCAQSLSRSVACLCLSLLASPLPPRPLPPRPLPLSPRAIPLKLTKRTAVDIAMRARFPILDTPHGEGGATSGGRRENRWWVPRVSSGAHGSKLDACKCQRCCWDGWMRFYPAYTHSHTHRHTPTHTHTPRLCARSRVERAADKLRSFLPSGVRLRDGLLRE
jgi:hypothetical protein